MPKFTVEIDLANDAMQEPTALPAILHNLARRLTFGGYESDGGRVLDMNGNDVGRWEIAN